MSAVPPRSDVNHTLTPFYLVVISLYRIDTFPMRDSQWLSPHSDRNRHTRANLTESPGPD